MSEQGIDEWLYHPKYKEEKHIFTNEANGLLTVGSKPLKKNT